MIDLRSDTVTLPTPEMREAIARAELGDDVYGEDPTVNRLEAMAAAAMGKEAALLVASGTMGNLIAMLVHCARGTKAVLGAHAHTYLYEAGGAAALGGVVMTPIRNNDDGEFALDELKAELETPPDPHFAPHALVAMENTHNRCGGEAVGLAHMAAVADLAHRHGLASISTARASSTPRSRSRPAQTVSPRAPIRFRSASRRASPARWARCCAGRDRSSNGRIACARCWAAGCARRGLSRRRELSR